MFLSPHVLITVTPFMWESVSPQNVAARLLTGTKKREHITPVLASLHWLPVKYRIDFKILLFVFKALNGLALAYISNVFSPYSMLRPFRSPDQLLLSVPCSRSKSKSDQAFSITAPRL